MSLKPLSFREIEEQTGDIYEAVVVMERRATVSYTHLTLPTKA